MTGQNDCQSHQGNILHSQLTHIYMFTILTIYVKDDIKEVLTVMKTFCLPPGAWVDALVWCQCRWSNTTELRSCERWWNSLNCSLAMEVIAGSPYPKGLWPRWSLQRGTVNRLHTHTNTSFESYSVMAPTCFAMTEVGVGWMMIWCGVTQ